METSDEPSGTLKIDVLPGKDRGGLDWADKHDQHKRIEEALRLMTPLEREIVRLRIVEGLTLEQIGRMFGKSRERIRQIETDAYLAGRGKQRIYRRGGPWNLKKQAERQAEKEIQGELEKSAGHGDSHIDNPWPPELGGRVDWGDAGSGRDDGEGQEGVG